MGESNYILAGAETLITYDKHLRIKNTQGNWDDQYTPKLYSKLLSTCCHGFLHSFGQDFTGRKNYSKYVEREVGVFQQCRDSGLYENSTLIADSGGFQVSIGKIAHHETEILIELYHEFLNNHSEVFDRAFILDIPPGPGCTIFKDWDDVYNYNNRTYNFAKNLPDHIRDKMIYVHHFRTPKLWEIYKDLVNQDGMFDSFKHFGTGGIVAALSGDTMPCIIYILPLIPILKKTIEAGRKELSFHILGGASYRDIFFYELFQKLVKEVHDVDLTISYDSSGAFKALMRGRVFSLLHGGMVHKMDMRSVNIRNRVHTNYRVIDIVREKINEMSDRFNFKRIDMTELYDDTINTFPDIFRTYAVLLTLREYAHVQQWLKKKTEEIYPVFQSGDLEEFNKQCSEVTQAINGGRITKKQKQKTNNVTNSLEMLVKLDESHCEYMINKYLAKDEYTTLDKKSRVLTF